MKRRTFFKTTALSSSAFALTGVSACTQQIKEIEKPNLTDFEFNEITIDEIQQKMKSGDLTAESICQKYLDRIKLLDPVLKAVIELNPDAIEIAKELDEERKAGNIRYFTGNSGSGSDGPDRAIRLREIDVPAVPQSHE